MWKYRKTKCVRVNSNANSYQWSAFNNVPFLVDIPWSKFGPLPPITYRQKCVWPCFTAPKNQHKVLIHWLYEFELNKTWKRNYMTIYKHSKTWSYNCNLLLHLLVIKKAPLQWHISPSCSSQHTVSLSWNQVYPDPLWYPSSHIKNF